MPKIKTRRCAAKRFKITGSGRIKCGKAYRRHLLVNKTTKNKRSLRSPGTVDDTMQHKIRALIPYA